MPPPNQETSPTISPTKVAKIARDVLIVDDNEAFRESLAQRIYEVLGITPFVAKGAEEALMILRDGGVKVAIVDQLLLNDLPGTELVKRIKMEHGMAFPCIMLTGRKEQVPHSDVLGLFAFHTKQELSTLSLCDSIRDAIASYNTNCSSHMVLRLKPGLTAKRPLFKFRPQVNVTNIHVILINDFIRDNEWETVFTASPGVKIEDAVSFELGLKALVEDTLGEKCTGEFGLELKNAVLGEVTSKVSQQMSTLHREVSETYSVLKLSRKVTVEPLPEAPADGSLHVKSRKYQCAPTYVRADCRMDLDCSLCGISSSVEFEVLMATDYVAERYIETMSDGTLRYGPVTRTRASRSLLQTDVN